MPSDELYQSFTAAGVDLGLTKELRKLALFQKRTVSARSFTFPEAARSPWTSAASRSHDG
jgi:hypothetical protein